MKNILSLVIVLISFTAISQPPQAFNYQGIARDSAGHPLLQQNIGIRISILDSSASGLAVYVETHNVTTNNSGLFNLSIGMGTVISGNFSAIPWATGKKWLQIEMDASGGNNYQLIGVTQFLSVPYALYAGSSSDGFKHYIGELYGGGIVFYVFKTAGIEHGLIASLSDLSTNQVWSNVFNIEIGTSAQSLWDGMSNSLAIVGQAGHNTSAAKVCIDYVYTDITGTYSDWYLPALNELQLLYNQQFMIEKNLPVGGLAGSIYYYSSTELTSETAYILVPKYGIITDYNKETAMRVRAIRSY